MAVVIPFIGAAIGGAIGGTFLGVAAASWGWLAGSLLASALFKPAGQHGPRLDDLTIVGTDYGQAFPWVFGSTRLAGQFIWCSALREIASTQKAGKGGGQKYTTYTYECDVLIRLSENVSLGVARDWLNAEVTRNGVVIKAGTYTSATIYTGEDDQLPDPVYEAAVGAGNAPAHRGGTTILIQGLQLGTGKQLPNFENEIGAAGATTGETDFLCQFQAAVPPDELGGGVNGVVAEVGPNIIAVGSESMTLSGDSMFGGSAGAGSGRTTTIAMSSQTLPWRSEGWVFCGRTNNAAQVARVESSTGVGHMEWGFGDASLGNTFAFTWSIAGVDSGGVSIPESSVPRPSPDAWYHWAIQFTGSALQFFFNGEFVYERPTLSTAFGATPGVRLFFDRQVTGEFIYDSTVLRSSLPGGELYPEGAYAVPSKAFSLYSDQVVPWLESTPDPESLRNCLIALLGRAGYEQSEFDVSAGFIGTVLAGYATGNITSTRAHLETIRPYGLFEANCSDKLYIFPRSTVPVGTIPWEDLGASETPGEQSDPFPLNVGNEVEVPAQIAVRYRNVLADWNTGTEFSDRLNSSLVSTQTVEMPFGLTPPQAKKVADTMLKDAIAGLGRASLKLGGRKHARYEPGDILTTTAPDGTGYRFRIITKRDHIFMLEWDVALDDASALESPAITDTGYVSTQDPARVAPALWETMTIRPLRDADASHPGPYVAITPDLESATDEWPGGVYVRARLPEAFEQQFLSGDRCVMGTCLTTLGDYTGGSGQVQSTGKLRVRVLGELSSAAYYDFFTDRTINAALVGNEPIRFMTAAFVQMEGVYRVYDLLNLLRGQLGMESEISGHVASERFVLLNNSIRRMVNETTDIDAEQQVKAVTLNLLLDSVTEEDFIDNGIALTPLAPVRLLAEANAGDLELSWIRRSRMVARWTTEGVVCPLGELTEAYRVKVYGDPGVAPVRTVTVTSPGWTYEAANQASDGFTTGAPITVTVQQLSDVVGEGEAVALETKAT